MFNKKLKDNELAFDNLRGCISQLQSQVDKIRNELISIKLSNEAVNKVLESTAGNVQKLIKERLEEISKVTEANRENLNLLLEYMGLHIEQINEKCIVEDDWCECDCDDEDCCANCE